MGGADDPDRLDALREAGGPARVPRPGENRLLAALPRADYQRLVPQLERVHLHPGQVLYRPNQPMPHVYFPLSGVISLVTVMAGGGAAEVATVGSEGMVGLPVFLGADFAPCEALCQVPGEAWRMPAAAFREAVQTAATVAPAGRGSPLVALLQHYTHALIIEIGQTAACNRLHRITERCARWLLQAHDRVEGDQFLLTHGFLAQMLGVRRATVTTVMGGLQQSGFIRYTRGRVTIVERRRLEAAACECYRVVKAEFDRLLGPG